MKDNHMTTMIYRCDSCDFSTTNEETFHPLADSPRVFERLDAGGIVPDGDCPRCGAFVYREKAQSNCGGDECCGCEVCTPDDANLPLGVVIAQLDSGIEVAQEALDIEPTDKTTLAYLMFQELDLEASDRYYFLECLWDSPVGYECMKVLRKAREFIDMLPDLDSHQDIWSAAFEQCDIFYCD